MLLKVKYYGYYFYRYYNYHSYHCVNTVITDIPSTNTMKEIATMKHRQANREELEVRGLEERERERGTRGRSWG